MNNQKENSGIHTKEKEEHKEQLMLNCSLCGKKLFAKESSDIIIETISASKYHFDSPQCAMMFKRLNHVYGENLKNFMGTSQFIADPFWDKTIPTEAEIKEINQETNKPDIKVITNREEALKTSLKLVKNGKRTKNYKRPS